MRSGGGVLPAANARGCSDSSVGSARKMPAERRKWRRVSGVFMVLFFEEETALDDFVDQRTEAPLRGFCLFEDGADFALVGCFNEPAGAVREQPDRERAGESIRIGKDEFFEFIHIGKLPPVGQLASRVHRRTLQVAHLLSLIHISEPTRLLSISY